MDWHTVVLAVLLLLALLYIVRLIVAASSPQPLPLKLAHFQVGDISAEAMRYYCGYDYSKPVLIAVRSKIYDVTKNAKLYGPGKELHAYAGKEIALALAKGSVSEEDMCDKLEGISEEESKRLEAKVAELDAEYDVVGKVVPLKDMTLAELARHDGSDPVLPLYLSIKGRVFNVSKGSAFYGPDGVYPFAGRECARALALMSTELTDCTDDVADLGHAELDALREWTERFNIKYPIVGTIVAE